MFTTICNAIKSRFDFQLNRRNNMTAAEIIADSLEKLTTKSTTPTETPDSFSAGQQDQKEQKLEQQPPQEELKTTRKMLGVILLQGSEEELALQLKTIAENDVKFHSHMFLDDKDKSNTIVNQIRALKENRIQIQRQMERKHDSFEESRRRHIKEKPDQEPKKKVMKGGGTQTAKNK